jgi:superfamily I DNA/RNA helicase
MNETWWVNPEQLDEEQKKVISLPMEDSFLVLGPPGSGKTNLLLLRANYLTKAGYPNILILVFGRTLEEFVITGSSKYQFSTSKIITSRRWMMKFLYQHDIKVELSNDFEESRNHLLEEMLKLVNKKNLSNIYEVILLDEAQDYLPGEIEVFNQLSKRIFAVADSRQKIYTGSDPLDLLKNIVSETCELNYHYRNGINICKLADGLAKESEDFSPLTPTSNYDEKTMPSSIEVIRCADIREQSEKIIQTINSQLKAYPQEYIGIICPRHEELDQISKFILASPLGSIAMIQNPDDKYFSFTGDKPIIICTLHAVNFRTF